MSNLRYLLLLGALSLDLSSPRAHDGELHLPEGFEQEAVLEGLRRPVAIEFAPDGRVFVAEHSGVIKVFASLDASTPKTISDLEPHVHYYSDRGLLGLAVDPSFPERPYIYVLYTHDYNPLDPEGGEPRWGDDCPDPPGGSDDGCVVNGRLSRLEIGADSTLVGEEVVLVEHRWCQQYFSHSMGDLVFDEEGALYVSAGEGSSSAFVDYGQGGGDSGSPTPINPCDDPPNGMGRRQSLPDAEGGALRSQDLRTPGDPIGYGGALLRVDPATGEALPDNPLTGGDPADDRIVAYGLRNPFRITARPGTREIWIGDVGWGWWEEINRVVNVTDPLVENFGWPCYEGPERQIRFDYANVTLCEELYQDTTDPAIEPFYAYPHDVHIDPDPEPFRCDKTGSSSISGLSFYSGTVYPADYDGSLFFLDYSRDCLFVMYADSEGLPDPETRTAFASGLANPIDLTLGPEGVLYYVDFLGGQVLRLNYDNQHPVAVAEGTPVTGPVPLVVQFDASGSVDPNDEQLDYAWDLDGDGQYDDSDQVAPTFTYSSPGEVRAGVRVSDSLGDSDTDALRIVAGNRPPTSAILEPSATGRWQVGQLIEFAGTAQDPDEGPLPASSLRWQILLHHCPGGEDSCHVHVEQDIEGISQGRFTGADHEWYSFYELILESEDTGIPGMGTGVLRSETRLNLVPETVELTLESRPAGLQLVATGHRSVTPFSIAAIVGSSNSLIAPSPQPTAAGEQRFFYWSDGGPASHQIPPPFQDQTFVATYLFDCTLYSCTRVLRVGPRSSPIVDSLTIQDAVDLATEPGTRIQILPGIYRESVVVDRGIPLVFERLEDGSGAPVVIDGGDSPAFDLLSTAQSRPIEIDGLTLRGRWGVRAAVPTRLDDLRLESIAGTALDLDQGVHRVTGLEMDPSVGSGADVAAGAELHVSRSRLTGSTRDALRVAGMARLENILISDSARGVTVLTGGTLELIHATVAGNDGIGVDNDGGAVTIAYSIVWDNAAGDLVGVACDDVRASDIGTVDCSSIHNNVSVDPQFDGSYQLTASSPVIDVGPPGDDPGGACTDLLGQPRVQGSDGSGQPRLDLGAFEHAGVSRSPGEIRGLRWLDHRSLTWDAAAEATAYHVYRGSLEQLADGPFGSCEDGMDSDRSDTLAIDTTLPPPGAGLFYLISAEGRGGVEGSIGLGSCVERRNLDPCPD